MTVLYAFRADGVTADLKGTVSNEKRPTGTHMHVDTLTLELTIKKVRMHINKVFKNNRILSECSRVSHWFAQSV